MTKRLSMSHFAQYGCQLQGYAREGPLTAELCLMTNGRELTGSMVPFADIGRLERVVRN